MPLRALIVYVWVLSGFEGGRRSSHSRTIPPTTTPHHTVTSQTAVECGYLRLPPKISEADWFDNVRKVMQTLVLFLKLSDLCIVLFSVVFSDPALDWGVQRLTTTTDATEGRG